MVQIKLIEDWKNAWKFSSVRNSIVGAVIMGAAEFLGQTWNGLPPALQERIPHASTIGLVLFLLNIVFRLFKYYKKDPNGND